MPYYFGMSLRFIFITPIGSAHAHGSAAVGVDAVVVFYQYFFLINIIYNFSELLKNIGNLYLKTVHQI
jgi:hypothetical protein